MLKGKGFNRPRGNARFSEGYGLQPVRKYFGMNAALAAEGMDSRVGPLPQRLKAANVCICYGGSKAPPLHPVGYRLYRPVVNEIVKAIA